MRFKKVNAVKYYIFNHLTLIYDGGIKMRYNTVIFDFDGTICDTGEGIKKSVAHALDKYNIPHEEWQKLNCFIGPPLLVTFQEKYNASPKLAEELVLAFRERYSKNILEESKLYDGIPKLLSNLKKHGVKIGIASSKPVDFINKLLEHFEIKQYFDTICGVTFKADCEPKYLIIERCMKELGADANKTIMVGDTKYDIEGAVMLNIDSCGVSFGFGSRFTMIEQGATYIAEKPDEIEAIALGFYEETTNVRRIFDGKIIRVHHDDVTLSNGKETRREIVSHPGGVGIIGIDENNEILLVRQFRAPYKELVYEIPAGKLELGEDPFEAGKREFEEECGAVAENFFSLGQVYPTPGYCGEIIHLYCATGISYTNQKLDDGEFLEVLKVSLDDAVKMVMENEIKDSKTIAAVMKANYLKQNGKL